MRALHGHGMTRRIGLCIGMAMVVVWSCGQAGPATRSAPQLATPESVAGCYQLSLERWRPTLELGEDVAYITPPAVVRLSTTQGTAVFEEKGMLVRPANGIAPSVHRASYWRLDGKTVLVVWTNGFSGLWMRLRPSSTGMEGEAESFWDFNRPTQRTHVEAKRVDC